ncbi:MAG: YigZ family protein [Spirochaetia bacterium]
MNSEITIPAGYAEAEHTVEGSRFVSNAGYCDTPETLENKRSEFAQAHKKASHIVHAARLLINEKPVCSSSDDREPPGTAGRPAFAVLEKNNIYQCFILIARYFGGKKLGTGGLYRAYSRAASLAVDKLSFQDTRSRMDVIIGTGYTHYEQVKQAVEAEEGNLLSEDFAENITLEVSVLSKSWNQLQSQLIELTSGRCEIIEKAGEH